MTATFATSAIDVTAVILDANTGPRRTWAPSRMADSAASAAPSGVPFVSRGRRMSCRSRISKSASWLDFKSASPSAALGPDRGSNRPRWIFFKAPSCSTSSGGIGPSSSMALLSRSGAVSSVGPGCPAQFASSPIPRAAKSRLYVERLAIV